ncbi:hypothetical protein HK103_000110 [Boothiomyces macroporosus]|uniref:Uncharacterized protein n=1 Tax=Boothiomyces macroporosus TaxID=261099 RepID=A0AAD5USP2_9FUNG|nr:hypothetical protein HK103_000110 [Boothiomyces macroporosus]
MVVKRKLSNASVYRPKFPKLLCKASDIEQNNLLYQQLIMHRDSIEKSIPFLDPIGIRFFSDALMHLSQAAQPGSLIYQEIMQLQEFVNDLLLYN